MDNQRNNQEYINDEISLKELGISIANGIKSFFIGLWKLIINIIYFILKPLLEKKSRNFIVISTGLITIIFLIFLILTPRKFNVNYKIFVSNWKIVDLIMLYDLFFDAENMNEIRVKSGYTNYSLFTWIEMFRTKFETAGFLNTNNNELEYTNFITKITYNNKGIVFEPFPSPRNIKQINVSIFGYEEELLNRVLPYIKESISEKMKEISLYYFFRNLSIESAEILATNRKNLYPLQEALVRDRKTLESLKNIKNKYGDVFKFNIEANQFFTLELRDADAAVFDKLLKLPLSSRIATLEADIETTKNNLEYNEKVSPYYESLIKISEEVLKEKDYSYSLITNLIEKYTLPSYKTQVYEFIITSMKNIEVKYSSLFIGKKDSLIPIPKEVVKKTILVFIILFLFFVSLTHIFVFIPEFIKQAKDFKY